jgi:hypothetical protein
MDETLRALITCRTEGGSAARNDGSGLGRAKNYYQGRLIQEGGSSTMGVGVRVRCRLCGDEIQSKQEGDFVRCKCGTIAVDAMRGSEGRTRILGQRDGYEVIHEDPLSALLGRPMRVVKLLPIYAFAGGWGDGWTEMHPSSLLRLDRPDERDPKLLHFWAGPEPVGLMATPGMRSGGLVHIDHMDSLADLTPIIERIEGVFGDQVKAWRWIQAPCGALEGRTPRSLLGTENGHQEIETILVRIEDGIYS